MSEWLCSIELPAGLNHSSLCSALLGAQRVELKTKFVMNIILVYCFSLTASGHNVNLFIES